MKIGFIVTGKVQNVGFRAYVKRCADQLQIAGEVWNRDDGAVAGFAQSADANLLEEFQRRLVNGPGKVGSVSVENDTGNEAATLPFRIGPTRQR